MKAAICRDFGAPLTIEEITLAPTGPGEVRVRIAACAICHSDITYASGAWGGSTPLVLGHEAAGYVIEAGAGVAGFQPGDPVLVTLIRACGSCPACAAEAPTSCHRARDPQTSPITDASGAPVTQAMATGAFAEEVLVDRSQLVALPAGIDMATASLLSCGVITGFGAVVNTAGVQAGQSCAVIGAGGVGLNAIQGARLSGADPIIAIDISENKLDAARRFGATHGLRGDDPDHAQALRDLTGGLGVDFVFVTVGAARVFQSAPDLLAPGGAMVMVGMPPSGAAVSYDPGNIAAMNQRLLGSRMGQSVPGRDIPMLLEHYRAGRLELDSLVTGRYPLERINEAIEDTKAGRALRNVIVFDS